VRGSNFGAIPDHCSGLTSQFTGAGKRKSSAALIPACGIILNECSIAHCDENRDEFTWQRAIGAADFFPLEAAMSGAHRGFLFASACSFTD